METPGDRLRKAREGAGFETAIEAADSLGVKRSTYIGHENGSRGFRADSAAVYARRFKVSAEWLLFGTGIDRKQEAEIVGIFKTVPASRRAEAIEILKLLSQTK